MVQKFIERPVLSIVISIFFVLIGTLALFSLPITQYPDIAPPAVVVTTKYTGASAEVCAKAVVTPLERAINGVPGMTYMNSVSSNDGTSIIQIYFEVATDPDIAAVNVQNRVQTIIDEMPEEVIKNGISTEKEINSMLLFINLKSNDKTVDEKFIYNFADINVLHELRRVNGVGFAEIMGNRDYSMRIWLKPAQLDAYGLSSEDVVKALNEANVEAAPGKIGEASGKRAQSFQYVLKYTGKYTEESQYENIVVKLGNSGELVRLKDIADVELGSIQYDVLSKEDGRPSAAIMLKQRPGSNASEVIEQVKDKMLELKAKQFPPSMDYTISYDVSRFLNASIKGVVKTLVEAFILVALVVFLFLQDFRSTIISLISIPVSLIGTFAFMQLFGFSINMLTLFALVLAIGIVVDNAIVVVEAVHAKMHEENMAPKEATKATMSEITKAIVAITLVMSAVFVPVSFLSGPVGVFYRQFSITMAISIVISGISALTLTPALCVILLKPLDASKKTKMQRFYDKFNNGFDKMTGKYAGILRKIANRRTLTIGIIGTFAIFTIGIANLVPSGFIPSEDQGTIYVNVTAPSGSTLERTEKVMDEIDNIIMKNKAVESISSLSGYSMVTEGIGASYGMSSINLKPWEERTMTDVELIETLTQQTKHIKDAEIQFLQPPAVPGFGNASGFEFRVLDKTGKDDMQNTADVTNKFLNDLRNQPEIGQVFTSFDPSFPQFLIHIDQEVAAKKKISVRAALDNLQALIGSYYATNFIRYGQMYRVMIQANPKFRAQPEDILSLRIKNNDGEMISYNSFAKIEKVYGPEQLTRYNMFTAAMINGEPAPGYSSGDAISAIERVASESLPRGFDYEWSGMTREQILSGNQVFYIFAICLIFVYLILSAQYESFWLPFPVLLFLPLGIFGTFFFLWVLGLENNIFAQVAMIMLVGLLGKNAILIIEFALLKLSEGKTIVQAAIDGAVVRLRPILMTSFAFTAGMIPLMLSSGAGAIGNKTIGSAAAGGMLFGTIFGVLVIPGLFVVFASLEKKLKK